MSLTRRQYWLLATSTGLIALYITAVCVSVISHDEPCQQPEKAFLRLSTWLFTNAIVGFFILSVEFAAYWFSVVVIGIFLRIVFLLFHLSWITVGFVLFARDGVAYDCFVDGTLLGVVSFIMQFSHYMLIMLGGIHCCYRIDDRYSDQEQRLLLS